MESFDLLWCGEYTDTREGELKDSDAFRLIAVSRGKVSISIQGQKQVLKTKDMLLIFPGEECILSDETENRGFLHIYNARFEIHDRKLLAKMRNLRQVKTVDNFYLVKSCFYRILQECEKKEDFYATTSSCYFWMILLELMPGEGGGVVGMSAGAGEGAEDIIPFPKAAGRDDREERANGRNADMYIVERYCRENYMRQISLEELIELVHYNKTSLLQRFREVYGTTPRNYIIQIRLQKAKELLTDTDYSISEISDQVGFTSVHYFSRFFKEKEKYSPLEYRMKRTKNRSYALEL